MPLILISILKHIWKYKTLYFIALLLIIIGIQQMRVRSLKKDIVKLEAKITEQHLVIENQETAISSLTQQIKIEKDQCAEKEKIYFQDLTECHKNTAENEKIDRIKGKIKKEVESVTQECLPAEQDCITTVYKCPDLTPMWDEYSLWTEKSNALFDIISD